MIDLKIIKQIQQASISERIKLIELILESLKGDVVSKTVTEQVTLKPFKVRTFNLGQEVLIDRNVIYAERGGTDVWN